MPWDSPSWPARIAVTFASDLRPIGDVVMRQRRGPHVVAVLPVCVEEPACQVGVPEVLEVHREERDVGQSVTQTEAVVELDAVEDPRPIVQTEDVVSEQISMPIHRSAVVDPPREELRPAIEVPVGHPLDDLDARAHVMERVDP